MKRILVATNLVKTSANALGRAIRLSATTRAALTVLHVTDEAEDPERSLSVKRSLRTEVEMMAQELTPISLDIEICLLGGSAEEAIVREAGRLEVDLIVLGAHGAPRFRDAIFGTTATYVARHSDRPLLVVQNDHASPYSEVLIAMPSAAASELVDSAVQIAPDAELHAVHAHSPTLSETFAGSAEIDRRELEEVRELDHVIAAANPDRVREVGDEPLATVRTGDPLSVIMKETEKLVPDLLVVGTRRSSSFPSSNAVDTLFWCPHDILIVPERAGADA